MCNDCKILSSCSLNGQSGLHGASAQLIVGRLDSVSAGESVCLFLQSALELALI